MLLALLFLRRRSSNYNNNNNNNNSRAFPFFLWRRLRRRSLPGSGRGRRSVISGGDKDGRLTTAAVGIKGLFFVFFFCFASLWYIINIIFFLFFFLFIYFF